MNVEGMEEARLVCTLSMDGKLASFLNPEANKWANPSTVLPSCRFSVDQLDKVYQAEGVVP